MPSEWQMNMKLDTKMIVDQIEHQNLILAQQQQQQIVQHFQQHPVAPPQQSPTISTIQIPTEASLKKWLKIN